MREENLSFKQAFTHLYFLMLSADRIADLEELNLGNKIVKLENLNKEEVMKELDALSSMPRDKVYEQGIHYLKTATHEIQLKCLAYINLMAKADGSVHDKESQLLTDLVEKELNFSMSEIFEIEKKLQKAIDRIS